MIKKLHELLKRHSGKMFIIGGLLLFLVAPLAVDKWIIGNNFPSNIESSDWISFLGGYIGGGFSLIGIGVTIWYTGREAHKDRALACAPLLVIAESEIVIEDYQRIRCGFQCENSDYEYFYNACFDVAVNNQGNGTAIDIHVFDIILKLSNGNKFICKDWGNTDRKMDREIAKCISQNEIKTMGFNFTLKVNYNELKNVLDTKEYGKICFNIKYKDLLNNQYYQVVEIGFHFIKALDEISWDIIYDELQYNYPKKVN